jgi:hypothetical protein
MISIITSDLAHSPKIFRQRRILIGSDPRNDLVLPGADISAFHLQVHQGRRLRVLSTNRQAIEVDGQETLSTHPVLPCQIRIGRTTLHLTDSRLAEFSSQSDHQSESTIPINPGPRPQTPPPPPLQTSPASPPALPGEDPAQRKTRKRWKVGKALLILLGILLLMNTLNKLGSDPDPADISASIPAQPPTHQLADRNPLEPAEVPRSRPSPPNSRWPTPVVNPLETLKQAARAKRTLSILFEDQILPKNQIGFCHHCGELQLLATISKGSYDLTFLTALPINALMPSQFSLGYREPNGSKVWELTIPTTPHERITYRKRSVIGQKVTWTEEEREVLESVTIETHSRESGIIIARGLQLLATAYGMPTPDQLSFPDATNQDDIVASLLQSMSQPAPRESHPQLREKPAPKTPPKSKPKPDPDPPQKKLTPKEELTRFVMAFYQANNTGNPTPAKQEFFADRVDYYDKIMTPREIKADQEEYFKKWPEREYQIDPADIALTFNPAGTVVTATTAFQIRLASRFRTLQGQREGTLKIDISRNAPPDHRHLVKGRWQGYHPLVKLAGPWPLESRLLHHHEDRRMPPEPGGRLTTHLCRHRKSKGDSGTGGGIPRPWHD